MATEYTPGRWIADGCAVEHFDAPMVHDIAVTALGINWRPSPDRAVCEANAQLIAEAPSLLGSLQMLVLNAFDDDGDDIQRCGECEQVGLSMGDVDHDDDCEVGKAMVVIERATRASA